MGEAKSLNLMEKAAEALATKRAGADSFLKVWSIKIYHLTKWIAQFPKKMKMTKKKMMMGKNKK